jgi:hypothetical protein
MRLAALQAAALLFVACALETGTAGAWYFPEHVAVTAEALREVSPLVLGPLERAIAEARKENFLVCSQGDLGLEKVGVPKPTVTKRLKADLFVGCVPFSALPALAGDHAANAHELEAMVYSPSDPFDPLAMPLGHEIVTASALEWRRFLAERRRDPIHVDRAGYVHALDVFLYFLDDDYVKRTVATHGHFHDAGKDIGDVTLDAAKGRQNNVLAQALTHHLRSLALARGGRRQRVEALFEHAFTLHFLADAYAAGHLVIRKADWFGGDDGARARHDYFSANGVRVRRALGVSPCNHAIPSGLSPCWLTYGDGYLGLESDSPDRAHVREALWLAMLEFAMALEPDYVRTQVEQMSPASLVAIGSRLEPTPWWVWPSSKVAPAVEVTDVTQRVNSALSSVERLGELPPGALSIGLVRAALHPFDFATRASTDLPADAAVGRDLFAPLLALWPVVDTDLGALHGELQVEHGLAFQLFGNVGTRVYGSADTPWDFIAPEVGGSMGLAYRVGNYVPGRVSRAMFEANAGLSIGLHASTDGEPVRLLPFFQQELRWPALWEIVTTYRQALSVSAIQNAGYLVFFSGVRMHELVSQPRFVVLGFDLEIAAWAIARGNGTYPIYQSSPELRFHLGLADPSPLAPDAHRAWGPYLSVTLTSGYATFL